MRPRGRSRADGGDGTAGLSGQLREKVEKHHLVPREAPSAYACFSKSYLPRSFIQMTASKALSFAASADG
jgi:hypothetical protein